MAAARKPRAPQTLGKAGKAVWNKIVATYTLRADELLTLEDACAITDMIAELTAEWEAQGRPHTARGSTGQLVIHPVIGEIRNQRSARNAIWRQLKLPDPETGAAPANQARDAAQSRWASHGKGA